MASQWPIPPGHFFDYELHPSAHEAGTYFYHSHIGFQAITASGPLVVKDAGSPPYAYDDELILQIGDFYAETDNTIESELSAIPQQWPGDPAAIQVNGQSGTAPTVENMTPDKSCQPYFINVKPDTTYRMRLIGGTAISMVSFVFAKHDSLVIVETDAQYVQQVTTDHIQIDSGQRFSLLFKTKSQAELDSLGMTMFWVQFETRESGSVQRAYAILNYKSNSSSGSSKRSPEPSNVYRHRAMRNAPESANAMPSSQSSSASGSGSGGGASHTWNPVQVPTSVSAVPTPTMSSVSQQNPSNATLMYGNIPYIPISPPLQIPYSESWLEYTFVNLNLPGYLQPIAASEVTRRVTIGWTQLAAANDSGRTIYLGDGYPWFDSPPSGPSVQSPYLVDIYKYGQAAVPDYNTALQYGGIDPNLDAWPALVGEVLEIVWQNEASDTGIYGVHPMHAHGGPYFDIGSGPGTYDAAANNAKMAAAGWQGSLRDTTPLYAPANAGQPFAVNGWRAWRVRVTEQNVGVWMMHCHILQHMSESSLPHRTFFILSLS